ncbi:MAG TPA: branched-chain amino acid ABC transporter permease [Symbiobacteriaceae bacterium]|nr:branched-chain amino acid ABC transporter permease [Symbiobacteriaceae bacterium]
MFWQIIANGAAVGSIYALIGIGFVLVYRSMGLFNFAQTEYYTLGGMVVYTLYQGLGMPYLPAMVLAVITMALVGVITERVAFRRLLVKGAPQVNMIIASIALGIVLRSIALLVWNSDPLRVPPISDRSIKLGSIMLEPQLLVILGTAIAAIAVVYWLLFRTPIGMALRATANNRAMAQMVGIRLDLMLPVTFALSAGLGALGGVLVSPIFFAQYNMGQAVLVKAFAAGILGGLSSIPGAIVGGLTVGLVENLAGWFISTAYKDVVAFVVLLAVLALRPQGILGKSPVEKV